MNIAYGNFGLWFLEVMVFAFPFKSAYLGASRTSRSATFPFSMEPCVFERPMLWAELIVEATRASARLIFKLTAAKCMTAGWKVFTRHVNIRTHYEFGASESCLKFKRFDFVTKFPRFSDQDQNQTGPPVLLITNLIDSFDINWANKVLFGSNFCLLSFSSARWRKKYMIRTMDKQKAFGLKSVPRATMTPWSIICLTGGCLSLTQWSEIQTSIRKLHGKNTNLFV